MPKHTNSFWNSKYSHWLPISTVCRIRISDKVILYLHLRYYIQRMWKSVQPSSGKCPQALKPSSKKAMKVRRDLGVGLAYILFLWPSF